MTAILTQLINSLRSGTIDTVSSEQSVQLRDCNVSKSEFEELWDTFDAAVNAKSPRLFIATITIASIVAEVRFIDSIRKTGILRPSKLAFDSIFVADALTQAITALAQLSIGAQTRTYFHTLQAIHILSPSVKQLINKLVHTLRCRSHPFMKRIFSLVELFFLTEFRNGLEGGQKIICSDEQEFWGREEFAASFSYLIHLFNTHVGTLDLRCDIESAPESDEVALACLMDAAHVRMAYEWEALVDGFCYNMQLNQDGIIELLPPSPEFERAVRLGFMQYEMRLKSTQYWEMAQPTSVSIRAVATELTRAISRTIQFRRIPKPRYAFEFPEPLLTDERMLATQALSSEEVVATRMLTRDSLIDNEELLTFEVAQNVQLIDLLRIQRVFQLIFRVTGEAVVPCATSDNRGSGMNIACRSALLCFTEEKLDSLLRAHVPESRRKDAIRLLTTTSAQNSVIDIQYEPFIEVVGGIVVGPCILGTSNVMRNALQRSGQRFASYTEERLPKAINSLFEMAGGASRSNVKYEFKGVKGEIDVLARIGNTLFVLETKHSLHPTSAHELRTSWEHIKKGFRQLNVLRDLLHKQEFTK